MPRTRKGVLSPQSKLTVNDDSTKHGPTEILTDDLFRPSDGTIRCVRFSVTNCCCPAIRSEEGLRTRDPELVGPSREVLETNNSPDDPQPPSSVEEPDKPDRVMDTAQH